MVEGIHRHSGQIARSALVFAVAGLIAFGTSASARPAPSGKRTVSAVEPAAATNVQLLNKKVVKLNSGGGDAAQFVMTVGSISHRFTCSAASGGTRIAWLQLKSSQPGSVLFVNGNSTTLTSAYGNYFNVQFHEPKGSSEPYEIMTPSGGFQHYLADISVYQLGAECVLRLAALSD
jgi:hypothetical protein